MIGVKRGAVALLPRDPEWEVEAAETIARLRAILADAAVDIQHVGSTSVRGICAKPIIDIAVACESFDDILQLEPVLKSAGFYKCNGFPEGQLLFARGSYYTGGDMQTHFIHFMGTRDTAWRNYINFRDYLNAHPDKAAEYEMLKRELAARFPSDRAAYTQGKADLITRLLGEALAWSQGQQKDYKETTAMIVQINDTAAKLAISREILEALPDWFGIEESREEYIRESASQPFFAAFDGDRPLGFLCLKRTGNATVELAVMGVLQERHRQGLGRNLVLAAKEYAKGEGYSFMQVKTVQMGRYDEYDATNRFYIGMGFLEFEVFPTLWDEANPCQVYVMGL